MTIKYRNQKLDFMLLFIVPALVTRSGGLAFCWWYGAFRHDWTDFYECLSWLGWVRGRYSIMYAWWHWLWWLFSLMQIILVNISNICVMECIMYFVSERCGGDGWLLRANRIHLMSVTKNGLWLSHTLLMKEDAEQRHHDVQELFNGLRYVICYGIAWRSIPWGIFWLCI